MTLRTSTFLASPQDGLDPGILFAPLAAIGCAELRRRRNRW